MYQKEIIYIGLYKDGNRIGSAGFLKVENRERESRFYLKVQNIPLGISGRFPVRIYNGSDWKELSNLIVQDGGGQWDETMPDNAEKTILLVSLSGRYTLEGRSKSASGMQVESRPEPVSAELVEAGTQAERIPQKQPAVNVDKDSEKIIITEELPRRMSGNIDIMPQDTPNCNLKEDKWEQILDTYDRIHPYGDERVYIKLEPKDFVILQAKYQHLVNNSFLLHGFYNYRYIILGKEKEYYLGVPGVFYDREKMVAQMFGFEAFECPSGDVKAGEFGYYLRKVEL